MRGLITSEKKVVCIKILQWFLEIFRTAPAVPFTDEDGAWMAAFVLGNVSMPAIWVNLIKRLFFVLHFNHG